MTLDRTLNRPESDYMHESNQTVAVDDKIIPCEMIGHVPSISSASKVVLVMRLHLLVNSYINLYVTDPIDETRTELVGYRMKERSESTIQSHRLTLDKLVCEMPTAMAFNQE